MPAPTNKEDHRGRDGKSDRKECRKMERRKNDLLTGFKEKESMKSEKIKQVGKEQDSIREEEQGREVCVVTICASPSPLSEWI